MREYKVVVLGSGGVGKSALTVQYVQGVYVESYDPTIEDSYRKSTVVDGRPVTLEILDTAGVEQFTAMRELYIKNGEGFILVYSVTNESSLKELAELKQQITRINDNPNVPIVLVGNKCDLEDERVISPEQGIATANEWNRIPFYETSAKYCSNVEDVFVDLVRQIMRRDSALGASSYGSASIDLASSDYKQYIAPAIPDDDDDLNNINSNKNGPKLKKHKSLRRLKSKASFIRRSGRSEHELAGGGSKDKSKDKDCIIM